MRIVLGLAVLMATGGAAEARTPYDVAMRPFNAGLARSCPAKRLDLLAPAALREVIDSYARTAPLPRRRAMLASENKVCATSIAGATCPNVADLLVARRQGFTRRLVALTCRTYRGCSAQSACTPAG